MQCRVLDCIPKPKGRPLLLHTSGWRRDRVLSARRNTFTVVWPRQYSDHFGLAWLSTMLAHVLSLFSVSRANRL